MPKFPSLKPAGRRVMALVAANGGVISLPPSHQSRVRRVADDLADGGWLRITSRSGGWATYVDPDSYDPTPYTLDELWSR